MLTRADTAHGAGWFFPPEGFGQKALSRYCVAFSREKEVDRRTCKIDSSIQVHPFAFDPDVRLVDTPESLVGLSSSATFVPNPGRNVAPSPDSDVVDQQDALGKEFLDFTVGQ